MANPEAVLISYVVKHRDYRTATQYGINNTVFHNYKNEWLWIERFVGKYGKAPGVSQFKGRFKTFRVLKTMEGDCKSLCDAVLVLHSQFALKRILQSGTVGVEDPGKTDSVITKMYQELIELRGVLDGAEQNRGNAIEDVDGAYTYVKNIRDRIDQHGSSGIPTGYRTLDKRTGGPMPGHLWIVGARLSHGKTFVLVKMAVDAVKNGFDVQFCSLEQPRQQIIMRAHTMMSRELSDKRGALDFTATQLANGNVGPDEYKKWLRTLPGDYPGKLHISDKGRGRVGVVEVAALIERNRPDIVFIDYLTLMAMAGQDWQAVQQLSGDLKNLAMSYDIPIVAAAQINRAGAGGKTNPGVENLAYSDSIGQDADAVLTVQKYSRSVHRMSMAKYRHGRDGYVWWSKFKPDRGEFDEIDRNLAEKMKREDAEDDDDDD